MPPELRILLDVARYRLRRLEMANMAAAAAVMWALRLSPGEVVVRLGFALLLNLLVYLNNDWHDAEDDIAAMGRDPVKTAFLRGHPAAAVRIQLILLGVLAVFGVWWGDGLLLALVLGAGVCWAYSAKLKRRPYVDVAAMIVWGVAMPLVAVPSGSAEGWRLVLQLGLFSGVFETIQVMRDHDEDRRLGVCTTAVALGLPKTRVLARALMIASGLYAMVAFSPWVGILPVLAVALPIPPGRLDGYWNRVRLILGPVLLIECMLVRWG